MVGAKMVLLAVVIAIVVAAAIFTGLNVFLALKTARGKESRYFNISYIPEHCTEVCRAHLVGKIYRPDNREMYVVEIHPKDAAKAYAWTVRDAGKRGAHLLEKGKFYKYAFKEELYG